MDRSDHLPALDSKIVAFLKSQTAVSISTCEGNVPYSCICFYAYSEKYNSLIFKSLTESFHIRQALLNNWVSGTILPDKLETAKVQGLQLSGRFRIPGENMLSDLKKTYYLKYPVALAIKGEIWAVELTFLKYTDNTLGFGKKLVWEG